MLRLPGQALVRAVLRARGPAAGHRVSQRSYALEANPAPLSKPAAANKTASSSTAFKEPKIVTPPPGLKPSSSTVAVPPPPPTPAIPPPPSPLPPRKKRFGLFTRLIFYGTLLTVTFYGGATAAALYNDRFHDFFFESIPLGEPILDYIEERSWKQRADGFSTSIKQAASEMPKNAQRLKDKAAQAATLAVAEVTHKVDSSQEKLNVKAQALKEKAGQAMKDAPPKVNAAVQEAKPDAASPPPPKPTEKPKLSGVVFSEGVADLVRKAEEALHGEATHNEATPPAGIRVDAGAPPPQPEPAPTGKVYTSPLPLGFEPPPGFILPAKEKPTDKSSDKPSDSSPDAASATHAKGPEAPPAPEPLPLVSEMVGHELTGAEPVIGQLASTIDALSHYLSSTSNPTAISAARSVIDTAQMDLRQLGERMEKIKDDERKALEKRLDHAREEWEGNMRAIERDAQERLDKQEDGWKAAFEEERTKLVNAYKEKLAGELATQSEIINQRLKEEVIAQGIELQRRWIREIKVRVEQERGQRLAKLDNLSSSLKQLERLTLDNSEYLDENLRLHALWSALRALQTAVESPVRRPFRDELRVLRNLAAARDDQLINAALDSLEASDVPDVGVEPYVDLATWFISTVSPRVISVALVPDENAGVLAHIASYVLSKLRFHRQGLVEGKDALSTLARAEYYVTEKDLDSAARELNQLKGTAKILLTDWLDAARRRLEVEQALEVVQTQATLASLLVV